MSLQKQLSSLESILQFRLAHMAPSGNMIFTSASLTTAPGMTVCTGTARIYEPVVASYPAESASGESHPRVNE